MVSAPPLVLAGVSFAYAPGAPRVLEHMDLALEPGRLTFVIGKNGGGKSTLLRLAAGLLSPDEGNVSVGGEAIATLRRREVARRLAYVPQRVVADFPFTVGEVVLQGRHPYVGVLASETAEDRDHATSALAEMEIEHLAARPVTNLSGGEQQLVQVAAAFAQDTAVLLLDEPTASLDPGHVLSLYRRLRARVDAGLTAMVVSHDLNEAAAFADRIVALAGGRIVADGTPAEVIEPVRLREIYGVDLQVQPPAGSSGRPVVLLAP